MLRRMKQIEIELVPGETVSMKIDCLTFRDIVGVKAVEKNFTAKMSMPSGSKTYMIGDLKEGEKKEGFEIGNYKVRSVVCFCFARIVR